MTRTRSLGRAKTEMKERSPPNQEENPIQEGVSNNGHRKWKSKIAMLEKKVRNQKRQFLVFNTAVKPCSDDKESDGSDKEYGNSKNSSVTLQAKSKRSKKT